MYKEKGCTHTTMGSKESQKELICSESSLGKSQFR